MEWFDFHSVGDLGCEACVYSPVLCEVCEQGFMHTQFTEELNAVEGRCDVCAQAELPPQIDEKEE